MANEFKVKNGLYVSGSTTITNNTTITGSLVVNGGITGSLLGTSSYAINATTASYALTASYLEGYVSPFPFTGSAIISGSLEVTGTLASNVFMNPQTIVNDVVIPAGYNALVLGPVDMSASIQIGSGSSLTILESLTNLATTGSNSFVGNQTITGSLVVTGGVTGSLQGTASIAINALTASYVANAQTASYVLNAQTASYVLNAISSSFASTASFVQNAQTASFVQNAVSASFASTASSADNFTVRNTLTAQTLVVQTVTSSIVYSSGSNIFGNDLSNTQVLTGSVTITGSLAVNGSNVILTNQTSSMSVATASFASTASYWSGSIINAETASFAQTAQTASFALNGGVTQIIAGPNIIVSPLSGKGQVTISSTGFGTGSFNTATGSYGSFYDTTIQTNPVANVARSMSFNETAITNGVSISGSTNPFNTYIKTENAGIYNLQFSAQVDKTDSGTDEIDIWLRKNGIDLIDTATKLTLTNNNTKVVAAWNWFVQSAANDYYQIIWSSADTGMRLFAEASSSNHPGIPSIIATVNRVDQFLSNTGSFSGSFSGVFTGSLFGTASQAQNAVSSSYALTSSYALNAGGGAGFPYSGSAVITGSLLVSGSGITGSLFGTASYATYALSASNAPGFTVQFSQTSSAATWSFTHNLNTRNPIVQVYGTDYKQIIPNDIVGTGVNTAEVRFDYATTGYVVMSNGGGLYVTGSTSELAQTVGATTWSFNHNLNSKYVNFTVYDSNDYVIIPANIRAIDSNSAELHFATSQTGRAVAQFSGINGAPNATSASFATTAATASYLNPITNSYVVLSQVSQSLNFVDDTAAAAGGVPLGGLYRNGNFILIRIS